MSGQAYARLAEAPETSRSGKSISSELLVLLPLLALYIAIILITSKAALEGDEGGYLYNAGRMVYGPPVTPQDLRLWWGPGYPIILIPFVVLKLPLMAARLLNAVFLFGAVAYLYLLLRRYIPRVPAQVAALCMGIYPPMLREAPFLVTESLEFLLMCGFMFHFCSLYNQSRQHRGHLIAASAYLAYLALAKTFFGYVLGATVVAALAVSLWPKMHAIRPALKVVCLALLASTPYLLYTYSLTGKLFYWGTDTGMNLYWLSSPYPNEVGSWFSAKEVNSDPDLAPHRPFFDKVKYLTDVERDEAFTQRAVFNLRHHFRHFVTNWLANVGRLLFSYPFSFGTQNLSTYFYILPNMFVVVFGILSMIPAILRPRSIPVEIWALFGFFMIAFLASTVLALFDRQFRPLVPILCVWIAFIYCRVLRVRLIAA